MELISPPYRLKFFHGLGDVVVFRNILNLLEGPIELQLNRRLGQAALFHNDPKVTVIEGPVDDDRFSNVNFLMQFTRECQTGTATKGRVCLEHEFGIKQPDFAFRPIPFTQLDNFTNEHTDATERFLEGVDHYVVCHFQGTSDPKGQNPPESFAERSIIRFLEAGYYVIVINYDYVFHHSGNRDFGIVDQDRVRSTYQRLPMQVESLWTLIRGAKAFYGVDSGPLHLALCSQTPCTYIHHSTRFLESFYDEGLEDLPIVDAVKESAIPHSLIPTCPG